MQRPKTLLATLFFCALLPVLTTACGQKGPLFLPDEEQPPTTEQPQEKEDPDEKDS
jgi:predicted small lipoprotein YifL